MLGMGSFCKSERLQWFLQANCLNGLPSTQHEITRHRQAGHPLTLHISSRYGYLNKYGHKAIVNS